MDKIGGGFYDVALDLSDGSFVDDLIAIERADEAAQFEKYGKLEPALYDRLQEISPDEIVKVAIWATGPPVRSELELYEALADAYPEAREAMELSGSALDVRDPDLSAILKEEYIRMQVEDTRLKTQPLLDRLEGYGQEVKTFDGMPAVALSLTKAEILEIATWDEVGMIYIIEGQVVPELDSAVPSDRVPVVWQRGYKGGGIGISILEPGKIQFNYLNGGDVRPCSLGIIDGHKTVVASAAASYHSEFTGVAPEVIVHYACTDWTEDDTVSGLDWATLGTNKDIVNFSASIGVYDDNQLHFIDKAFDHYARTRKATILVVSGNHDPGEYYYVGSPGKAWNVLTIGAFDNKENTFWSDDEMWPDSRWVNPTSNHSDREKPEVAAPGVYITGIGLNDNLEDWDGTSFATSQVTGLSGLLFDRYSYFNSWPQALKAIVMASAVHNLEGPSGIPTGEDLKDGAGGVVAFLADNLAKNRWYSAESPCDEPCWSAFGITNNSFPYNNYLYRYFNASKGERVRVVIAWYSNADCPDSGHCYYDRLDTNLNLGVYDPDGNLVDGAWSASWDNNYELVEFTAPVSGKYKIGVNKDRMDETYNELGIAWVKDATYLPNIKSDWYGWDSEITIRNDSNEFDPVEDKFVYIQFFNSDGSVRLSDYPCYLEPNGNCTINPPFENFIGSAIIDGGEDISAVVNTRGIYLPEYIYSHAYTGVSIPGASSPIQAGTAHYAPILYRQYGYRSTINIQNTGVNSADVTIKFRWPSGTIKLTKNYPIPANGIERIELWGLPLGDFFGTATIESTEPVAVYVESINSNDDKRVNMDYNVPSSGYTDVYLPYLMKYYAGWGSCFTVQNTTSSNTIINTVYYPFSDGSVNGPQINLGGMAAQTVCQANISGLPNGGSSAVVTSTQPVVIVVNQDNVNWGGGGHQVMSYTGLEFGVKSIALPYAVKNFHTGVETWNSGITVQNVGSQATVITAEFYASDGYLEATYDWNGAQIPPNSAAGLYLPNVNGLPDDFTGSVIVYADQPLLALSNASCTSGCEDPETEELLTDTSLTYNGVNR